MADDRKRQFALSAKVVIRNEQGRCLVLRRSQASANNAGMWDFPGGKIDRGESFEEGLLREVEEETGLRISLDRVVGFAESRLPARSVAYLILEGHLTAGEPQVSHEHDKARWVTLEELKALKKDVCPQFEDFVQSYAEDRIDHR